MPSARARSRSQTHARRPWEKRKIALLLQHPQELIEEERIAGRLLGDELGELADFGRALVQRVGHQCLHVLLREAPEPHAAYLDTSAPELVDGERERMFGVDLVVAIRADQSKCAGSGIAARHRSVERGGVAHCRSSRKSTERVPPARSSREESRRTRGRNGSAIRRAARRNGG